MKIVGHAITNGLGEKAVLEIKAHFEYKPKLDEVEEAVSFLLKDLVLTVHREGLKINRIMFDLEAY